MNELDRRLAELADSSDPYDLVDLGCELFDVGRLDDAEGCFRRVADQGDAVAAYNLGNTLRDLDRPEEAVAAYEQATAGGETDAWLNLGNVLDGLGDLVAAMQAYRQAERAGDPHGGLALGFMLREQGEREQALEAARRSVALGNRMAVGVLACWRWDESLDPALEPDLRAGAEHYPSARVDLADLLRSTQRLDEARQVLEQGAKLGEEEAWLPLGNLYADDLDERDAAVEAYRSGIRAGDSYCHNNLGLLLEEDGDLDGAEAQFRLGADAGDALAARHLRELLGDSDDSDSGDTDDGNTDDRTD